MTAQRYSTARTLAAERGRRTYFTGLACKHGHLAERDTISGSCTDCKRSASAADRERIKALLQAAAKGRR